jgi:hypothetical protein
MRGLGSHQGLWRPQFLSPTWPNNFPFPSSAPLTLLSSLSGWPEPADADFLIRSFLPKAHMPDMVSVAVSRAKSRGTAFVLFDIKLRRLVSKLRRLSPRARELHSPLSQSCEIVMASSLQGALSVARPPEVSRFGTFVKPTVDLF